MGPVEDDEGAKLLQAKGNAHEQSFLAKLAAKGLTIAEIDGFQIALLAARPLRLKNFAELEMDTQICQRGGRLWIEIAPEKTKKQKTISIGFPEELEPH